MIKLTIGDVIIIIKTFQSTYSDGSGDDGAETKILKERR